MTYKYSSSVANESLNVPAVVCLRCCLPDFNDQSFYTFSQNTITGLHSLLFTTTVHGRPSWFSCWVKWQSILSDTIHHSTHTVHCLQTCFSRPLWVKMLPCGSLLLPYFLRHQSYHQSFTLFSYPSVQLLYLLCVHNTHLTGILISSMPHTVI